MTITPARLGPFLIEAEIGRGGMGVVYRAHDARLDRPVALKALAPELAESEERLARFKREARLVAQLNHPHIAQVYQLLDHEGTTYVVFEYVPGRSLAEMIEEDGALGPEEALTLCIQIARAMEAAHARGIVHRDLKPANVRVTDDGVAKVLDFGIAKALAARAKRGQAGVATVLAGRKDLARARGRLVGTPGYMAPEQARGELVDARADIFSFGCVLYECLTGACAFAGETTEDLINAVLSADPDLGRLPEPLPPRVRLLVQDCLMKAVEDRLQSIADARIALSAALGRRASTPAVTRVPADVANNLPLPMTSFIGRVRQLQELSNLLPASRLVTLMGAGGCGKTRLALELARCLMSDFPDGVYLAELAATTNPDFIPRAVAAVLGVKDAARKTTTDVLSEHLADRTILLVLDNCEHVLEAASDLAAALLRAAAGLRIIATSRQALGVPGETTWRVPSLSLPDDAAEDITAAESVALFLDRARLVRPGFTLQPSDAPAVARICRRLDGIPLALELAAARVKMLTPAEIERRLDDRFRLLTGGPHRVDERHRTLRAAVDWSYRTLPDREKKMLRGLSVFAGGWTLEGAASVCGVCRVGGDGEPDLDDLETLDLLTRLADKSLIVVDDVGAEIRYRLLETLREYTAEKLAEVAEEMSAARDRHLDFYLALAQRAEPELTGDDQGVWLARLEVEHENVLAALDRCDVAEGGARKAQSLCAAMRWFWAGHGHFKVGYAASCAALMRPGGEDRTPERAGAAHVAGAIALRLGDYDQAARFQTEALDIRRELDDQRGIADALNSLGNLAYFKGELAEARRLHEESLNIKRRLEDTAGIARSLNNLGNVANDQGDLPGAQRMYEESLALNRSTGNRASEAINLNNLGLLASCRGDFVEAGRLHEESLDIRRELGDTFGVAESLGNLGEVAQDTRDLTRARRLHRESLGLRSELGDKLGMAISLDGCAILANLMEEHGRAARLLGAGDRLREQIGAPRPDPEHQRLDPHVTVALDAMGETSFRETREAGRSLTLDGAVAETLAWLRDHGPDGSDTTGSRPTPGSARDSDAG